MSGIDPHRRLQLSDLLDGVVEHGSQVLAGEVGPTGEIGTANFTQENGVSGEEGDVLAGGVSELEAGAFKSVSRGVDGLELDGAEGE